MQVGAGRPPGRTDRADARSRGDVLPGPHVDFTQMAVHADHAAPVIDALLIASGPLTAITLFLFAYGARRIPYSTMGLLQYIAPSLQLACGVFAFHEPFERTQATGFALIWAALVIYAGDGLWRAR